MVLKRISIFGFKSFADKTTLSMGEGITAVVGPNGCGKSNVVDAVRWVFGEQKASALRSTSMQDVIFSGTQARAQLNMAEVTLTIQNNRGLLPVEYSEVAITRRIFRSGESEYRINKVPCRLRDIHNLFLDTGIGSNAYTTIENSMINAILSDKAEERRVLFEEAAGIGKYKQRRKESLRKLEYTRQDLLRINDKVEDRTHDVRVLARQVEKAKRYRNWHDECKTLELGYENRHFLSLQESMQQRKTTLEEEEGILESIKASIATAESWIQQINLEAVEKERRLGEAAIRVSKCQEQIVALDKEISINSESVRHLAGNIDRFGQEVTALEEQIEEKQQLRLSLEKSKIETESLLQQHEESFVGIVDELTDFDYTLTQMRQDADRLSQEQIALINETGQQRSRIADSRNHLKSILDQRERNAREITSLGTAREEVHEKLQESQTQLKAACEEHEKLSGSRQSLVTRIEKEDARYQKLLETEKQLEARIDAHRTQLEFLQGLDAQHEGYEQGVKALLEADDLPGRLGTVADLISVEDEKNVQVVEHALGSGIQAVVFETDKDMMHGIEFLSSHESGPARLISLERLRSLTTPDRLGNGSGLRSFVSTCHEHALLADHLFNRAVIAESSNQALHKSLEGGTWATREGLVCRETGTVIAGSLRAGHAGILTRKQRIESLPAEIAWLEKELGTIVHEKEMCIITRDEAKVALAEVNTRLSAGQRRQQEQETNIKHYRHEFDSLHEKIAVLENEQIEVAALIDKSEVEVRSCEARLQECIEKSAELEKEVEAARRCVAEKEESRKEIVDRMTTIQIRIEGDKHKIAQNDSDLRTLARDVDTLATKKQRTLVEQQEAGARIEESKNRIRLLGQDLEKARTERQQQDEHHTQAREVYNQSLASLEEVRAAAKKDQVRANELSQKIFGMSNEQTRCEEQLRSIREKVFELYKIDLVSPDREITPLTMEDAEAREAIRTYKERLSRLTGQVNMAAPEEYETKSQELKELTTQRDDLQTAVDDLERAIKKLNREARTRFLETFEEVRKNFVNMFTTLFEGGEAHLELEENVDPLEAPIKINVRPPGKKMRGVQLLSGGERALTAISLLFALYMVKPSAYCILDELDAPLDDANVDRFVRVLRKFSEKTQFIIITHNKRTMEAADLLYGVTQQEKGVSTLVSVRLDEAMRHAA